MNTPPNKPKKSQLPNLIEYKLMKEERSKKLLTKNAISDFKITNFEKENLGNDGASVSLTNGGTFHRISFQEQ